MKKPLIILATLIFASVANANGEATKERYQSSCAYCHESGAAGAPRTGDFAAWQPRIDKGLSGLVASTKQGLGRMPPKGMCSSCSDGELEALIKYMLTTKRETEAL